MKKLSNVCVGLFLGCTALFGGVCLAGNGLVNVDHIVTVEKTDANGHSKTVTTFDVNGKTNATTYDAYVAE